MKITNPFLPFILFCVYTNYFLSAAIGGPSPVLDIAGKNLRSGVEYYILPVIRGRGGGLTMDSTGTCPPHVVQEQQEVDFGYPLTFTPVNSEDGMIHVSTDLNIKFSAVTICAQSTVWKLDNYDELLDQYFVTTGGIEGQPGRETLSNWFKIEEYDRDYKLMFCPSVCSYCKVICKDVGIFMQDGVRLLALSDVPLRVVFKKA